ncbi:MAG TPA: hypothetical protein PKC43_03510 [Phycisphaerales bacterium]|nr:hypothetical protein [Phycisphaerales bacterium]HMP36497.1 hypothetical protein [Phycisphaerales bacterium]
MRLTTIHVTHEASEKIGGIGAVLEGLITSPVYQEAVGRTILVGPLFDHFDSPAAARLGPHGEVLYSTLDGIDRVNLGYRMRPIEWAFNVAMVFGRRRFRTAEDGRTGEAEILLVDVNRIVRTRLDHFKARLWECFGLDCHRYEHDWAFEEYVRLAEPAFHAAMALLRPEELPAVLLAHEFMGLPAAFKAILDGQRQVRTLFHAHECSTARRLVEDRPGHDASFYPALRAARRSGMVVDEVFGDQSPWFRHALVSRAHLCDAVLAVGTMVAEEMHFLDRHFDHHEIDLVHNGIPAWVLTPEECRAARRRIDAWCLDVVGFAPDVLLTHVTRPVISKGVWRDIALLRRIAPALEAEGRRAVLLVLTSAGGTRRPQDALAMRREYGWPRAHRLGYPDLVGPEVDLASMIDAFNAEHPTVQAVLVNQFGFSGELTGRPEIDAGPSTPPQRPIDMATLRAATDVELGMATYEPFGISPLEPLAAGAICVISGVCGCRWFAEEAAGGDPAPNVLVADFEPPGAPVDLDAALAIGRAERDAIEAAVIDALAPRLLAALPRSDADRERLLVRGRALAARMGWDEVLRHHLLPTMRRIVAAPGEGSGAGSIAHPGASPDASSPRG